MCRITHPAVLYIFDLAVFWSVCDRNFGCLFISLKVENSQLQFSLRYLYMSFPFSICGFAFSFWLILTLLGLFIQLAGSLSFISPITKQGYLSQFLVCTFQLHFGSAT